MDSIEEVETIFQETQDVSEVNDLTYDLYVPLSVLIEDPNWDDLTPENQVSEETNEEAEILMPACILICGE